jgi:hypothetical protein
MLLSVLAVWEIVAGYRSGVAGATEGADQALYRALEAAAKAGEHVRQAKGLELQAMQRAAAVVDDGDDDARARATISAVREVKREVEGMVKEVGGLGATVDKVRMQAEKAKVVAEEGDLELAGDMVVNVEKLLEKVVQGEKKVGERVEVMRGKLWKMSLGHGSG